MLTEAAYSTDDEACSVNIHLVSFRLRLAGLSTVLLGLELAVALVLGLELAVALVLGLELAVALVESVLAVALVESVLAPLAGWEYLPDTALQVSVVRIRLAAVNCCLPSSL
jgi:hypothetical protein